MTQPATFRFGVRWLESRSPGDSALFAMGGLSDHEVPVRWHIEFARCSIGIWNVGRFAVVSRGIFCTPEIEGFRSREVRSVEHICEIDEWISRMKFVMGSIQQMQSRSHTGAVVLRDFGFEGAWSWAFRGLAPANHSMIPAFQTIAFLSVFLNGFLNDEAADDVAFD